MTWDSADTVAGKDIVDVSTLSLYEAAERLKNGLISRATGGTFDEAEYKAIRARLLRESRFARLVPAFLRTCRDVGEFWSYIREHPSYEERRSDLRFVFSPLLDELEQYELKTAVLETHSDSIKKIGSPYIEDKWRKALDRCDEDPESAVTLTRSLVESVCKCILDDAGVEYKDDGDLLVLYRHVKQQLNLDPSAHSEQCFLKILSGCHGIVEGLAEARNKFGDAHGKGAAKCYRAEPRHAHLAVSVGGGAARFLWETWEARQSKSKSRQIESEDSSANA